MTWVGSMRSVRSYNIVIDDQNQIDQAIMNYSHSFRYLIVWVYMCCYCFGWHINTKRIESLTIYRSNQKIPRDSTPSHASSSFGANITTSGSIGSTRT